MRTALTASLAIWAGPNRSRAASSAMGMTGALTWSARKFVSSRVIRVRTALPFFRKRSPTTTRLYGMLGLIADTRRSRLPATLCPPPDRPECTSIARAS